MNACWPGFTRPYSWRAIRAMVAWLCNAELSPASLVSSRLQNCDRAFLDRDGLLLSEVGAAGYTKRYMAPTRTRTAIVIFVILTAKRMRPLTMLLKWQVLPK